MVPGCRCIVVLICVLLLHVFAQEPIRGDDLNVHALQLDYDWSCCRRACTCHPSYKKEVCLTLVCPQAHLTTNLPTNTTTHSSMSTVYVLYTMSPQTVVMCLQGQRISTMRLGSSMMLSFGKPWHTYIDIHASVPIYACVHVYTHNIYTYLVCTKP